MHGRSARAGFGLGALFGLGFFLPLLRWTGIYVGPVPWLALSGAEAVFVGAAGAGAAGVSRLRGGPLWAAAVWVGVEALRARTPFGGFPWGRVAFGQPDGPLLPVAAVGGAPLLSFATVLAGFALGDAVPEKAAPVDLAVYDRLADAAGLSFIARYATWDKQPYVPGGSYAVTVHRRVNG